MHTPSYYRDIYDRELSTEEGIIKYISAKLGRLLGVKKSVQIYRSMNKVKVLAKAREYRLNNLEAYNKRVKAHTKKDIEMLSDSYLCLILTRELNISRAELKALKEYNLLIDLKRKELLLKRKIRSYVKNKDA